MKKFFVILLCLGLMGLMGSAMVGCSKDDGKTTKTTTTKTTTT